MDPIAELEAVLLEMTTVEGVQHATEYLGAFLNNPESIPMFMHILANSQRPEVRQGAAVMVRKRASGHWGTFSVEQQTEMKNTLLNCIFNDKEFLVRSNAAAIVSTIARGDLPLRQWDELVPNLVQAAESAEAHHREMAMVILSQCADIIGKVDKSLFSEIGRVSVACLADQASARARVAAMYVLINIAAAAANEAELEPFYHLVHPMINVIADCLNAGDDDKASMAFEALDDLLNFAGTLLTANLELVVRFMLHLASNTDYDENMRSCGINFLEQLTQRKAKSLGKLNAVAEILNCISVCIGYPEEDPAANNTLHKNAAQLLDRLCTCLNPKHIMSTSLAIVDAMRQSQDPAQRKGAVVYLGMMAEGCQEFMRNMLNELLPVIFQAAQDQDLQVRVSAAYTLIMFSEYLGPTIHEHHKEIMGHLFSAVQNDNEEMRDMACEALEIYVLNLGDSIVDYLEPMTEAMLFVLEHGSRQSQCIAVTGMGATANAGGVRFQPFFERVMPLLMQILDCTEDDDLNLRAHATETSAIVVKAVGLEMASPYINALMEKVLAGLNLNYFMLGEYSYSCFARIAELLGDQFQPYMETIVPILCEVAVAADVELVTKEINDATDHIDSDEEEDAAQQQGGVVPQGVINERGSAVAAIGAIALATGGNFMPYMPSALAAIKHGVEYHADDVRTAAVISMMNVVLAVNNAYPSEPWVIGYPPQVPVSEQTLQLCEANMDLCLHTITTDDVVETVGRAFESVAKATKTIGPAGLGTGAQVERWLEVLEKLASKQLIVQQEPSDAEDEEGGGAKDDDDDSPLDLAVLESDIFVDCLEATAAVLGRGITPLVREIGKTLTTYLRPNRQVYDRTTFAGAIGVLLNAMGPDCVEFLELFIGPLLKGLEDQEGETRRNCSFSVGLLFEHCGATAEGYQMHGLVALKKLLANESDPLSRDNAVAAVARMVIGGSATLPLAQIVPELVGCLPLQADAEENKTLFACLFTLLQNQEPTTVSHLGHILGAFLSLLGTAALPEQLQRDGMGLLKMMSEDAAFGPVINGALGQLGGDLQQTWVNALAAL